jgi:hypothetical protein
MPRSTMVMSKTFWAVLVALAIGFVVGRMGPVAGIGATTSPGTPSPEASAITEDELAELERLRTQVAQTPVGVVCTPPPSPTNTTVPSPTPTPSPTATPTPVPPAAMDEPLPYPENWTIAVTGIASATNIGDNIPDGIFMIVSLTVTNNEATERFFPYGDFVLVDDQGRPFVEDVFLASRVPIDQPINFQFPPSLPLDTAIVFDVATDVGTSFILESTADPTFRVKADIEMRG